MQPLRDYQARTVDAVRAQWRLGKRRVLVVAPTAAGKTRMGEELVLPFASALWIAHRTELIADASERLKAALGPLEVGIIAPGFSPSPFSRVQVSTIQTLLKRNLRPPANLVILDECFPAGTMIDGAPIESLLVGGQVESYNHANGKKETKRIARCFKSRPSELVTVWLSDGTSITCTAGHPFYAVGCGYVEARALAGRDVCRLQSSGGIVQRRAGDLQSGMQSEQRIDDDESNECSLGRECSATNVGSKPNGATGGDRENARNAQGEWASTENERREWKTDECATADVTRGAARIQAGTSGADRIRFSRVSEPLQNRHRQSSADDGDRGGRRISRWESAEAERCAEGRIFALVRVDRVEVRERGSDGTFGGMCPDGFVYNIEVEDNHNYFADGVLVHNCHHFAADDWSQIYDAYPDAFFLLLTATPERQDGRAMGDCCDAMVVAASHSELLAGGYITPVRAFRPPEILGSDLALDPVEAWQRYAGDGCGFAFHATVALAHGVTDRMIAVGIKAVTVEQNTKRAVRADAIEALRAGEIACINNVYTMTEGTDVPRANVCMLASAAHHCGGYLQKTGRVLRAFPGKTHAILIDLVGASILHGLPTENRIYSLDGKPIKRTEVVPLRSCLACGAVVHAAYVKCPDCGHVFEVSKRRGPRIYSMELQEVFAGADTPEDAKRVEYMRLRELQRERGFDLYFVVKSYSELFGERPIIRDASSEEKRAEFAKLQAVARQRGFKPGFAKVRFKDLFGHWPS